MANGKKFIEQCGIKRKDILRITRQMLEKYERGDASVRVCRMASDPDKAYVMGNKKK